MGTFNLLYTVLECPNCGIESEHDIEFRFGLLNLFHYHLGDQIDWSGGLRVPTTPPPDGNYTGEGYAECPRCSGDFWVWITVTDWYIESVQINDQKQGYKQS